MTDKMREAMIDQDGAVWEKIGGAWSLYKPAQSVPVVGEPVECLMCGGSGDSRQPQCCGQRESDGACCGYPDPEMCYQCEGTGVIYRKSVKPIPAAELAELREKAAMADELQKDAEKWRDLCSRVGADPSGTISYAGPLEGAPEDWAAIAQERE